MKFLILALAVACAQARPVVSHLKSSDANVPIIKADYDLNPEGSFQYAYETGNGIAAQAQGVVKNPNSEYPSLEVQGSVKYTSPEGEPVSLTYVANEEGYQPQGSHIPVAPPVPEYITRALNYIASHPPPAPSAQYGGLRPSSAKAFQSLVGK